MHARLPGSLAVLAAALIGANANPTFNQCVKDVVASCNDPRQRAVNMGKVVEDCAWSNVESRYPGFSIIASVSAEVTVAHFPLGSVPRAPSTTDHQLELDGLLVSGSGAAKTISHLLSAKLDPGAVPGSFAGDEAKLGCMLNPHLNPPAPATAFPLTQSTTATGTYENFKTAVEACFPGGIAGEPVGNLWKLVSTIRIKVTDKAGAQTVYNKPADFQAAFQRAPAVARVGITTKPAPAAQGITYILHPFTRQELATYFQSKGC